MLFRRTIRGFSITCFCVWCFHGDSDGKESICNAGDPISILCQEDPLEKVLCLFSASQKLCSLLHQRTSCPFSFPRQVSPPAHYPSLHSLSRLKQSDFFHFCYIFYFCILQLISCHYFFSFFLKCITQFLR